MTLARATRWGLALGAVLLGAVMLGLTLQLWTEPPPPLTAPPAPNRPDPLVPASPLGSVGPDLALPSAEPTYGSPLRIMPLGDSITAGVGSVTRSSYRIDLYRRLVAAGMNVDFVGSQHDGQGGDDDHEGHPGWAITRLSTHVDGWLARYRPDVVLLHVGTNDMATDGGARRAPMRLNALISRIRADRPEAQIFVSLIVGAKTDAEQRRIEAFNAAVPGVVAANGPHVHLVDQSTVNGLDIRDNLHPNDFGYATMAYNFYEAIGEVFSAVGASWPSTSNPYRAVMAYRCVAPPSLPGMGKQQVTCNWYRHDTIVGRGNIPRGVYYR